MPRQSILISVFIPTYNPNIDRLSKTLASLKEQTFPIENWELIIIDNNSTIEFESFINIGWHPNAKFIKEPISGLTFARINGFLNSIGNVIIMVDDDNILNKDYLSESYSIFNNFTKIGAIGGKSLPLFEETPPIWLNNFYANLALRDLGSNFIIKEWEYTYPDMAPIGAGMAIRKEALNTYVKKIQSGNNKITDRKGDNLSSGGDNDIILEILKSGWKIAYAPSLSLQHIIPKGRMNAKYLARLNKDSTKSWIHLLENHGINPWQKIPRWTLPFRIMKSFFLCKPWKNETNYIKWKGTCGMYKALSEL